MKIPWIYDIDGVLQILCLANGERISLTHGMRLIFEVDDLSQASPATVSRCAMVYMVGTPQHISPPPPYSELYVLSKHFIQHHMAVQPYHLQKEFSILCHTG
jgi:hypothetical protein